MLKNRSLSELTIPQTLDRPRNLQYKSNKQLNSLRHQKTLSSVQSNKTLLDKGYSTLQDSKEQSVKIKSHKYFTSTLTSPTNGVLTDSSNNCKRINNADSQSNHKRNFSSARNTPTNSKQLSHLPKKPSILNRNRTVSCTGSFTQAFKLGRVLGKGRFGKVYSAQHIKTRTLYAVKQINIQKVSSQLLERLIAEIKIQTFIQHQHCLGLYKFYKENNKLFLVMELCEMSLFQLLRESRYLSERETAYYIRQTIKALTHLHKHGIIHRDLKPENIVLVQNMVKLADFGWSAYIGENDKRTTFCGTLDYISPEIVLGNSYDTAVDVWSVGILCYELCTGHAPFQSYRNNKETIYEKIVKVDVKFPKHLSKGIQNFIKLLLNRRPSHRMTLQEALQHPWMKQYESKNHVSQ